MSYRDLGNLLLRVAGAAIIIYVLIGIPSYVSAYFASQRESLGAFLGLAMVPMLVPLVAGVALFLFPSAITNRVVSGDPEPDALRYDAIVLEKVAFSVLGLYLLFDVLSDLTFHAVSLYLARSSGNEFTYNTGYAHPYALIVSTLAEFAFALYLLLGSRGLSQLLARFRGRLDGIDR